MPKIVSTEKRGFVLSQETMDGAILAHETLHSIHEFSILSFIVKLDMMKA